jgi:hypothetical protein
VTQVLRHPHETRKKGSPILTHSAAPYALHKIRRENIDVIRKIATAFHQRVERLNVPLDEANKLALEYWIGAATTAKALGLSALNDDIAKLGVLEVSSRGFQAICELAL